MAKNTFVLKTDLDKRTKKLTDEELGKLMRKIFKYVKGEDMPTLSEKLEAVFDFIQEDIDENQKRYEDTCKKRKAAVKKRWGQVEEENTNEYKSIQKYTNDTDNEYEYDYESSKEDKKEIKTKKKFIKPTIDEVSSYCKERGNKIDAQKFIDYYEANGWQVGRNSMRDWKAAIRTWEKNDGSFSNKRATKEGPIPDWFDKKMIDIQEITEEERIEMGELINAISK